jgi:metal-responsive CopG/Arc/MetJ family transcriptional regulator
MKTLTVKLPDGLASWVDKEAQRIKRPKSELVREALQQYQKKKRPSALDLAADLVGSAHSGLKDLSYNKKYLEGFGE